ncbi:hypothetical protein ACFCYM_07395 [Streptomyces sp. NPDC056254]|uniref:hypothetical protein n=1 Tax=Streptomyces sp. NPDC056254 TaxID=3345763 RepID=UPI0035DE97DB
MNNTKRALVAFALAGAALTMSGTAHASPPDYIGFAKAVRDDPIGFVNWKLDLPIPDQYAKLGGPSIKVAKLTGDVITG